jgi:hypothetical protein
MVQISSVLPARALAVSSAFNPPALADVDYCNELLKQIGKAGTDVDRFENQYYAAQHHAPPKTGEDIYVTVEFFVAAQKEWERLTKLYNEKCKKPPPPPVTVPETKEVTEKNPETGPSAKMIRRPDGPSKLPDLGPTPTAAPLLFALKPTLSPVAAQTWRDTIKEIIDAGFVVSAAMLFRTFAKVGTGSVGVVLSTTLMHADGPWPEQRDFKGKHLVRVQNALTQGGFPGTDLKPSDDYPLYVDPSDPLIVYPSSPVNKPYSGFEDIRLAPGDTQLKITDPNDKTKIKTLPADGRSVSVVNFVTGKELPPLQK